MTSALIALSGKRATQTGSRHDLSLSESELSAIPPSARREMPATPRRAGNSRPTLDRCC